ncbi:MAG: peptidase M50 [Methanospirillum sp.]|nr:peptidase M50 [Methanospirillum sp.]
MLERIPRRERIDLVIAWLAIAIAFTLIFVRGGTTPDMLVYYFALSLFTVGIGFVFHELAHKFVAMRFGYWAEFRKDNQMLLVAVVLAALAGVVFAAPGATVIYGDRIGRRENGIIAAAGPGISIALALGFLVVFLVTPVATFPWLLGLFGMRINAMIAAFNMLPVSVLDGKKVLGWNVGVFVVLIATAFALVYLTYVLPGAF